jgi:CBS domain-containing protein
MTQPAMNVSALMTSPVVTVEPDMPLEAAYRLLTEWKISSVPVLDAEGKALGVLSLTDLLRLGRLQPASLAGVQPLDLPNEPVGDHMHRGVLMVRPDAPVTQAARVMVENHVHRVYVDDDGRLVGVFSIEEVFLAVRGLRIETPLREVMSSPVITLPVTATLTEATARLDRVGISGLCIVDEEGYPIGMFTQVEALGARDMAAETRVEEVMSYALCQHVKTPLHRAAAQAYEARARRLLVVENGKLLGLVTGLDFARVLSTVA